MWQSMQRVEQQSSASFRDAEVQQGILEDELTMHTQAADEAAHTSSMRGNAASRLARLRWSHCRLEPHLNYSEAEGLIQGWLHKGSPSVSNHAVQLSVLHWILLRYKPSASTERLTGVRQLAA